jgi:hypothetical protein
MINVLRGTPIELAERIISYLDTYTQATK